MVLLPTILEIVKKWLSTDTKKVVFDLGLGTLWHSDLEVVEIWLPKGVVPSPLPGSAPWRINQLCLDILHRSMYFLAGIVGDSSVPSESESFQSFCPREWRGLWSQRVRPCFGVGFRFTARAAARAAGSVYCKIIGSQR